MFAYVKLRALAIAQVSAEKFVSVDVANIEKAIKVLRTTQKRPAMRFASLG